MELNDKTLVEKILKTKFLLGVSYRTMGRKIGTSAQSIYNYRKIRPNSISESKKMELNTLLDSYLSITHREEKENR